MAMGTFCLPLAFTAACQGGKEVISVQAEASLLLHYEIWKYSQSTSRAHAKELENLMVGCSI